MSAHLRIVRSEEVSTDLVAQAVAYARDHVGEAAARRIGVDAVTEGDILLDALCVLSCADQYPPDPLGADLADAVAGTFGDSAAWRRAFESNDRATSGHHHPLARA